MLTIPYQTTTHHYLLLFSITYLTNLHVQTFYYFLFAYVLVFLLNPSKEISPQTTVIFLEVDLITSHDGPDDLNRFAVFS